MSGWFCQNTTSNALFSQNTTSPSHGQSVYHLYCPCSVSTLSLLSVPSQNTIWPAYFQLVHHIQSVHHLYCPCPVSTPPVLIMFYQNAISPAHVLSVHHLCHTCAIRIPPLLPIYIVTTLPILLMSSQYTICPANILSVDNLPKPSQYSFFPINVKSEYHVYCPCPDGNLYTPCLISIPSLQLWANLYPCLPYMPTQYLSVQPISRQYSSLQTMSRQNHSSTTHAHVNGQILPMYPHFNI